MLPDIDFLRSDVFGAVGIAVKPKNSDKSQMYLTLDNARKRTGWHSRSYMLALMQTALPRLTVDVALIDFEAESVFGEKRSWMHLGGSIARTVARQSTTPPICRSRYAVFLNDHARSGPALELYRADPGRTRAYTPPDDDIEKLYVDEVSDYVDGAKELENGRLVASFEKKHFDARFIASVFARGADLSTAFF